MTKNKVFNVLVFVGMVANFTLIFDRKPNSKEIMNACEERMKNWLSEQGQDLKFHFRLEEDKIFANNIELDVKITEGDLYTSVENKYNIVILGSNERFPVNSVQEAIDFVYGIYKKGDVNLKELTEFILLEGFTVAETLEVYRTVKLIIG